MEMEVKLSAVAYEEMFREKLFSFPEESDFKFFSLAEKASQQIKLIVLLKDEENEKAGSNDLDLLNKIADFKDYDLKRDEVVVLNLAHQSASFLQLQKRFSFRNLVAFGILPSEIGLQTDYSINRLFQFRNINFVFTESLSSIQKNEKLKKQFFLEALKPMFIVAK